MGLGPSMKETTLHYYRDPMLEVCSEDSDVNVMGVIIYGSADENKFKLETAARVGATAWGMRADGALLSCNGEGNNHVDYAQCIAELEKCGVTTVAMSMVPKEYFVTQNEYMTNNIVCYYKATDHVGQIGDETTYMCENNYDSIDVKKSLALLKLRMRNKK